MEEFTTLGKTETERVSVVERSRFIGSAISVGSEEDAKGFLSKIKKRYYDATHHCYAYCGGFGQKFSDDGEPSGTAGAPILETIRRQALTNVIVVVTRYFGGIKLGAGGLTRAYAKAAGGVLDAAEKRTFVRAAKGILRCSYTEYMPLRKTAERFGKITKETFGGEISFCIIVPQRVRETLETALRNLSGGKVLPEWIGETWDCF